MNPQAQRMAFQLRSWAARASKRAICTLVGLPEDETHSDPGRAPQPSGAGHSASSAVATASGLRSRQRERMMLVVVIGTVSPRAYRGEHGSKQGVAADPGGRPLSLRGLPSRLRMAG
jgi:hypothetical protein